MKVNLRFSDYDKKLKAIKRLEELFREARTIMEWELGTNVELEIDGEAEPPEKSSGANN